MSKRILIIEDELDLAMTISERLKAAGFETRTANDGIAGIEALKKEKFQLIILDIMMPNMDGLSFAAILRSRDDAKDVPVIVMTAKDDDETKATCGNLGVAAFLEKPYDPEKLISKVKQLLRDAHKEV